LIAERTTVLVVDDREINRYTTTHALTRAGFDVVEATTGKEALELSRNLPAVIVLDVKLPDILGYEVCRRIKANEITRHIPVLQLSSAFLSNESKLFALESGADAYLIQPADPIVLVATVKSLVRLHRAESQAQLAAQQWQATFDALSEGVAIVDASGNIQRCNRAMTVLLGMTYGEIENAPLPDLLKQRFGPAIVLTPSTQSSEVKAGSQFFRLSLYPIASHQQTSAGSIFIVGETTKQKLAEEALLISERLAATGRISHTIAHEINNPLEALTNLLFLLQGSLDKPEVAREFVDTAANELDRVARITRQILSFNRESSEPIETRASEIVEDVLALNNRALVDKRLEVEQRWNASRSVNGYPAQLRQVFSNLIRNAVDASLPGGRIRIRTSDTTMHRPTEQKAVRVTIGDFGVGIPHENLGRIFEAFFTTKSLKGSGIGLWLCANIIQEQGGRIQVRSKAASAHSGTCFSILLPCVHADSGEAAATASSGTASNRS
jgi:two-component system NtrC family sensor kinase